MRAINHALTGAVIGLGVSDPLIAAPLALASHFVLDAIPHSGSAKDKKNPSNRNFIYSLIADGLLCFILVLLLAISRPIHWVTAIICAFLAASPDFFSINRFYKSIKKQPWSPNLYSRFAGKIQWFEKPAGRVVEIVWLGSFLFCLYIFLHR